MRASLVPVALMLGLLAVASASQAQPFYNSFQGASWVPGNFPMDLSAAVQDPNSSFPLAGNYLTQFTNDGIYVFDKFTEQSVFVQDQWDF